MLGIMPDGVDMQGIMRMERRLNGNGKYVWKGRVCVGEQKWHKSKTVVK